MRRIVTVSFAGVLTCADMFGVTGPPEAS